MDLTPEQIDALLAEFPPECEVWKLSPEEREALAVVAADMRTRRIMDIIDSREGEL